MALTLGGGPSQLSVGKVSAEELRGMQRVACDGGRQGMRDLGTKV